jgi:hypothetical protein
MKTIKLIEMRVLKTTGVIELVFHKLSSDGDKLDEFNTAIVPGKAIEPVIQYINDLLGPAGFASVSAEDIESITVAARATWTPENIAPVTAQVVKAIAVQQAAITEAAAKKAELESKTEQEIGDAKAREVAANEAKALAEAAEAASVAAKEAAAKAAADLEAENARVAEALRVAEAAKIAAAEQAKFDKAVADAVAKLAPVEAVA